MDINVLKLPENRQIFSRQSAIAFSLFYTALYTLYVNEEFSVHVCCSVLSIRKVEVETNNNHTRRDIYNVIAVLRGSVEPGGFPCAYYNVNILVCRGSVEPGGCPVHTITSLLFC